MRHLGYTRVSTATQDAQLQLDALLGAGVQKRDVFSDVTSGSRTAIERGQVPGSGVAILR